LELNLGRFYSGNLLLQEDSVEKITKPAVASQEGPRYDSPTGSLARASTPRARAH